ncbi:MAG: aldehyde dehydrogenase family protein [Terriglobus roseus]|nr:aldehyde dehydrogenase family protein [Terriglobus roseus]
MSLVQSLVGPNGRRIELPTGLFINNEFVASTGGTISTVNPSNEEEICAVSAASEHDVDKAVRAARAALKDPSWKDITATERAAMMNKLADLMAETREDLATLEAWDNGKPYAAALDEDLEEAMSTLRYYAGWTDKMHGQTMSRASLGEKFAFTIRQPIGVCGQIIPWNYPLGNSP